MLAVAFLAFSLTSCIKDKTQPVLTKKQINQKVDSIVAVRSKELEELGQRDLHDRIIIEVRVKADSIFQARTQAVKKDTAKKIISTQK